MTTLTRLPDLSRQATIKRRQRAREQLGLPGPGAGRWKVPRQDREQLDAAARALRFLLDTSGSARPSFGDRRDAHIRAARLVMDHREGWVVIVGDKVAWSDDPGRVASWATSGGVARILCCEDCWPESLS